MIGIDTNIFIRYLILDDEVQYKKTSNLINKYIDQLY